MFSKTDWSRAEKFSKDHKYFNISVVWIFYYRYIIRLLYYLKIPPMMVLTLSFICGLISALLLYQHHLVFSAVFLHIKDIFDACDGSLARLRSRTSRIGRFLDSLEDMVILTLIILIITVQSYNSHKEIYYFMLGALTWLSLFIQCSYFNYYQLKYAQATDRVDLNSRIDEKPTEDERSFYNNRFKQLILNVLQFMYRVFYSWQDEFIKRIDLCYISGLTPVDLSKWYSQKLFLILNSALCFGTHIFIFMICMIFGSPTLALWIISVIFNMYFMIILILRWIYCAKLVNGISQK